MVISSTQVSGIITQIFIFEIIREITWVIKTPIFMYFSWFEKSPSHERGVQKHEIVWIVSKQLDKALYLNKRLECKVTKKYFKSIQRCQLIISLFKLKTVITMECIVHMLN